ncbi:MAG: UDP-N-acetylmuramoyl-L-alanine--D-glutamate ligase [Bacteroidales bacterium]|nr:UDP-N-acetylmuramoyl-L-alanine--D-glutamate ligase [Bacteroidales bacterium]
MVKINTIFKRLRGKRILILGFGREGRSSLAFIQKYLPHAIVGIADKNESAFKNLIINPNNPTNPTNPKLYFGENYFNAINDYDIVLKTPGISLLGKNVDLSKITSQTDLFLEEFHNQIIGVTGTKGKSTTSTLICHLLKESGRDAILAGNIGLPVFDIIENINEKSIIVFELSAHQLQFIHRSPHIGILLNVFEEHLDHFGTFEAYRNAKLNIIRYMGEKDWAVTTDEFSYFASEMMLHTINYQYYDFDVDWDRIPLKGEHNKLNIKAALCSIQAFGVPVDEVLPYLKTFKPLEHRQELVGTFRGVTFYNDSISTIPQAAVAALQTIKNVRFLLLGGYDREIDYTPLVDYLLKNPVAHILFTGKAGERMLSMLEANDYQGDVNKFKDLAEAFEIIRKKAKTGDTCLLSPAAASYDQYKNFEERGRVFKDFAKAF